MADDNLNQRRPFVPEPRGRSRQIRSWRIADHRGEGDGGGSVSARLDRSQEGLELRRAVWAGFVKSRYWRIAQWIEPHAVVGAIIFLGTLLYIGLVLVQKRLPNATTLNIFFVAIGLPSLWYVVHQNRGLLRRFWKNPWGKLFYTLAAAATVTLCKVLADQEIRWLTQSNPSLFPSAQQAITVLNIILMIFVEIGGLLFLISMFMYCKEGFLSTGQMLWSPFNNAFHIKDMLGLPSRRRTFRQIIREVTRFFAYLWAGIFILTSIADFTAVVPFDLTEELLLLSSFIPNGRTESDRVCINLPPDTRVSPFDTRTPVPSEVLMAQPIRTGPDSSGRSYTYHVIACSRPTPSVPPDAGSSAAAGTIFAEGRGTGHGRRRSPGSAH